MSKYAEVEDFELVVKHSYGASIGVYDEGAVKKYLKREDIRYMIAEPYGVLKEKFRAILKIYCNTNVEVNRKAREITKECEELRGKVSNYYWLK